MMRCKKANFRQLVSFFEMLPGVKQIYFDISLFVNLFISRVTYTHTIQSEFSVS
jgi:hypothetical protein